MIAIPAGRFGSHRSGSGLRRGCAALQTGTSLAQFPAIGPGICAHIYQLRAFHAGSARSSGGGVWVVPPARGQRLVSGSLSVQSERVRHG